jgi:Dolichyl-phosphate-mannose--protein O-mannosyl transferase
MYIKNTFYYDAHPPLGNQLVSAASYLAGYKGKTQAWTLMLISEVTTELC